MNDGSDPHYGSYSTHQIVDQIIVAEAEVALATFLWASSLLPAMIVAFVCAWDVLSQHCASMDDRRPTSQRAL